MQQIKEIIRVQIDFHRMQKDLIRVKQASWKRFCRQRARPALASHLFDLQDSLFGTFQRRVRQQLRSGGAMARVGLEELDITDLAPLEISQFLAST